MRDLTSPGLAPALAVPFGLMEDAFRRLTHLVKEMGPEELAYTAPGDRNSTATLLAHLAVVDLGYLYCIKGSPIPPKLEAEYGPYETEEGLLPEVTGRSAAELLERYGRVIDMVREYLKTKTDAEAEREVQIAWWPQSASVRYVLWHMAGHCMLHQGQIARLRSAYKQGR